MYDTRWAAGHVEVFWTLIKVAGELTFDVARREGVGPLFVPILRANVMQRDGGFVFEDHSARRGTTYRYRVVIREDGEVATSFEVSLTTPGARFSLGQNHPNPFNPSTSINYSIHEEAVVRLAVYDTAGGLIRVLVDERLPTGAHSTQWDGNDIRGNPVASGMYLYRLTAGDRTLTRKALLLK
ncbi:MAG: T9SS type A sorting domain-containing protein [Gammaproteobacteria bacterium]|nr:T9SS type A sorting domain-containing protein [Gammaproteobacteria bacterium]